MRLHLPAQLHVTPPRGGNGGAPIPDPPIPDPPLLSLPRAPNSYTHNNALNILQHNINGIQNKHMELKSLLHKHNIHIATIQETKLTPARLTPKFPGYTTLRLDRPTRGGGGLITLIHKSIPFTNTTAETHARMPHDPTLEIQSSRIQIHKQTYNIFNIYIPPTDSTPPGYHPQLNYMNTINNSFILGDFNAHDTTWLASQYTDTRADTITTQLDNYIIMNDPHSNLSTPTHNPHHPTSHFSIPT